MRRVVDDERMMHLVCDLYYNQHMGQKEIAQKVGLSRPTVSRLLVNAREKGVVKIILTDLSGRNNMDLEQKLQRKYGLKEVIISDSHDTKGEMQAELGRVAAAFLERILHNGALVGVSMGTTLHHMIPHLTADFYTGVTFMPMIGGVGEAALEVHSNYLAEAMAKALGGHALTFHAPAMVSRVQVKNELLQEESIARIISRASQIDIALSGIGAPEEHSTIITTGYFSGSMIEEFKRNCGDICLQFYDQDGRLSSDEHNSRVVGVDIAQLRKVTWSVGVAGGVEKADAIRGAIAGGYINTLVTDYRCALQL